MALETSILKATKKVLNVPSTLDAFDQDILMHLNAAFTTLDTLGVGPSGGVTVEEVDTTWDSLGVPPNQLNMIKSYVYLKVRSLFDPPGTSFHLKAFEDQIKEMEWRLRTLVEDVEET